MVHLRVDLGSRPGRFAALVVASGLSLAALVRAADQPAGLTAAVAVWLVVLTGFLGGAWSALVVALAASCGSVAAQRELGPWGPESLSALLLAWGVLAGGVATSFLPRAHRGRVERSWSWQHPTAPPPYSDLGLLSRTAILARLEEEIAGRSRHGRGLTLALVELRTPSSLAPTDQRIARRAAVRLLTTRLDELDVPFALSESRVGVLFPHTTESEVWRSLTEMVTDRGLVTVRVGKDRTERSLEELVSFEVALDRQQGAPVPASELVDHLESALADPGRRGEAPST